MKDFYIRIEFMPDGKVSALVRRETTGEEFKANADSLEMLIALGKTAMQLKEALGK